jgi:hypothetical protein
MTMQRSIFEDIFETDPLGQRALFESHRPGFASTSSQRQTFSGMFPNIFNEFLGQLGQQVRTTGQPGPQSYTDWLNEQDFGRQFRRNTAGSSSPLTSTARWLFNT